MHPGAEFVLEPVFPHMSLVLFTTLKLSQTLNNSCLLKKYTSAAYAIQGIGKTTYSS